MAVHCCMTLSSVKEVKGEVHAGKLGMGLYCRQFSHVACCSLVFPLYQFRRIKILSNIFLKNTYLCTHIKINDGLSNI